jgi:hypothetical protein
MNEGKFGDMFLHKKDDPRCNGLLQDLYQKWTSAVPATATRIRDYFEDLAKHVQNNRLPQEIYRCNYSGIKYNMEGEK